MQSTCTSKYHVVVVMLESLFRFNCHGSSSSAWTRWQKKNDHRRHHHIVGTVYIILRNNHARLANCKAIIKSHCEAKWVLFHHSNELKECLMFCVVFFRLCSRFIHFVMVLSFTWYFLPLSVNGERKIINYIFFSIFLNSLKDDDAANYAFVAAFHSNRADRCLVCGFWMMTGWKE